MPPILEERLARVDPARNPFWRNAERELWTAERDGRIVGTAAAIHDRQRVRALGRPEGSFGFFECRDDAEAACRLIGTAAEWLAARGLATMAGPYNPGASEDMGVLVDGFDTRPAVMEAHNPPYYPRLLEAAGMRPQREVYARLLVRPPGSRGFLEDAHPRLRRAIELAAGRGLDVAVRTIDPRRWDEDIRTACRLFNEALAEVPEHVPIPEEEFLVQARELRPVMDRELALLAEVDGIPAGFCLAIPDVNEALLAADGRWDLPAKVRFLWRSRRLSRLSFKIMIVHPRFRDRFVEVRLLHRLGEAAWRKGYREIDLSLTGEENVRSNRIQEKTGARIYRRYRIYVRDVAAGSADTGGAS